MAESERVTVLLADQDALRRDGIDALLRESARLSITCRCGDGESALRSLRELRPALAIIDLNLPGIHGLELVRRAKAENLGSRILIVSGINDDDVVREAIRAGADGYLLRNSPSRHLLDAISYVLDGGQYFSPQLGRNGLDRRLLEDSPRVPDSPQRAMREAGSEPRIGNPRSNSGKRRTGDPHRVRERLQEEGPRYGLGGEVLSALAESMRPILERLDEIENRVGDMETGAAPVPSDPQEWLKSQLVTTLRGEPTDIAPARLQDLDARIPQMIEDAVARRFQHMAGKLEKQIEETHLRALESFVRNIQVKLVQRVSALESDIAHQAEAMNELRDSSRRTEDNLSRLITGVDRLAKDLPRALPPAAKIPEEACEPGSGPLSGEPPLKRAAAPRRRFWKKSFWTGVISIAVLATGFVGFSISRRVASAAGDGRRATQPASLRGKMLAARTYIDRGEYGPAESVLKEALQAEPDNTEVVKSLASVLYREEKFAESAAVLDRLPSRK